MLNYRKLVVLFFFAAPLCAIADIAQDELPSDTVWYMHADLETMRSSESGSGLYQWFDGEINVEVFDEVGVNINEEVDRITAFSTPSGGTVVLIEGRVSKGSQSKVLTLVEDETDVTEREYRGMVYYKSVDPDDDHYDVDGDAQAFFDDIEDGGYFSFAIDGRLIITTSELQMQSMLDSSGVIPGSGSHEGALFVMTADKTFMQAGLRTDEYADDDDDWDSNIIRNTEQVAIMVSDMAGMIAVEAKLVSTDPAMAASIGGIASGLIALQAFNSDIDPGLQSLLANTRVEVIGNVLSINTIIEPDVIVSILED